MRFYDTLRPYDEVGYKGIQYSVCRDYGHISRHKGLRQVIHSPGDIYDRFIALETPNSFNTGVDMQYYYVPAVEENRLDIIANKFLGSASYSWIIAYFNDISDGYTVREGQRLRIPKSISSLFSNGEILAAIPPLQLNLGTE